ncbi:MAG: hypothetical protein ACK4R6_01395 [Spirosomataceae bacterium]
MKNLLLTIALMCCATFAFANDGDKKENPKMKETVEQKVVSNENVNFTWECFGLSCRTVCFDVLSNPSFEQLVEAWETLEADLCRR